MVRPTGKPTYLRRHTKSRNQARLLALAMMVVIMINFKVNGQVELVPLYKELVADFAHVDSNER